MNDSKIQELDTKIDDLERRIQQMEMILQRNLPALDAAWRNVPLGAPVQPINRAGG